MLPTAADAYQVEQDPIDFGGYFPGYATNELIVLHESGNGNNVGPNSLDNETAYETQLDERLCFIFCRFWWSREAVSASWPDSMGSGATANAKHMHRSNLLERIIKKHSRKTMLPMSI